MEFSDGALGFLDGVHGDKTETLRLFGFAMSDDLGVLYLTYAIEELEQIALTGVERQVADIKLGGRDFHRFGLA